MNPEVKFVEDVVKSLVEYPEDVKVNRTVDDLGVLLTLEVNQTDMGKVIGKDGNHAKAIRTLLRAVGLKHSARVNLKIYDPQREERKTVNSELDEELKGL